MRHFSSFKSVIIPQNVFVNLYFVLLQFFSVALPLFLYDSWSRQNYMWNSSKHFATCAQEKEHFSFFVTICKCFSTFRQKTEHNCLQFEQLWVVFVFVIKTDYGSSQFYSPKYVRIISLRKSSHVFFLALIGYMFLFCVMLWLLQEKYNCFSSHYMQI